jgi:hypothetical protein
LDRVPPVFINARGDAINLDAARSFMRQHRFAILVALAGLVLAGLSVRDGMASKGTESLHVHQAQALLNGRLDIPDSAAEMHDVVRYGNQYYVIFPPFPAILLTPFVALFGARETNVVLLAILLSLLNAFVLKRILSRFATDPSVVPWVLTAFFFGTAYWMCVCFSGGVWYFAHVVAVTCLLLSIDEALGKGRGYLAGAYIAFAFLTRQCTIVTAVFVLALLWRHPGKTTPRARWACAGGLALSLGAGLALYLMYNWARFGNALETGYAFLDLQSFLYWRAEKYGLFHLVYVPFNFIHMFLEGFHIEFAGRENLRLVGMDEFGTSLTAASPFIFIALRAKGDRFLMAAAWCSILVILGQLLMYYNNGFVQVNGQRFALDFLPILILLVAMGASRVSPHLLKAAVIYSVVLNVIALVVVPELQKLQIYLTDKGVIQFL